MTTKPSSSFIDGDVSPEKVAPSPKSNDLQLSSVDKITENIKKGNHLRFIADPTLGGVTRHLRLLGVDCIHDQFITNNYMLFLARQDNRIILTRNRKLIHKIVEMRAVTQRRKQKRKSKQKKLTPEEKQKRKEEIIAKLSKELGEDFEFEFEDEDDEEEEEKEESEELGEDGDKLQNEDEVYGYPYCYYFVRGRKIKEQIREVVDKFKLIFDEDLLFTRCSKCNGKVELIDKESIKDQVFENVYEDNDVFAKCSECKQIYWGNLRVNDNSTYHKARRFAQENSYPTRSSQS